MAYNYDVKLKSAKGHEIGIDTESCYGYWERPDGSEGGGLWFVKAENGKLDLVDYDGTSVLNQAIVDKLRESGHTAGPEFDAA